MSITTMEQLQAVPIGTTIRVNKDSTNVWTRTETGLTRDGTNLDLSAFTGAMSSGLVERTDHIMERGDYFRPTRGRVGYLVIGVDGDQVRVVSIQNDVYYTHSTYSRADLVSSPKVAPPAYAPWVLMVGDHLFNNQVVAGPSPDLVQALRVYVNDEGDDNLEELLVRHGVELDAPHNTKVIISGKSHVPLSTETAGNQFGAEFNIVDVDGGMEVEWRRTVTLTHTGRGCTCDQVGRDEVQQFLPSVGTVQDWEFDVDCAV